MIDWETDTCIQVWFSCQEFINHKNLRIIYSLQNCWPCFHFKMLCKLKLKCFCSYRTFVLVKWKSIADRKMPRQRNENQIRCELGTRSHDVSGDLGQNNGGGGLQPEEQKELCIVHSSSPIQTKPNQPIKTKPDLVLSKDTKSNIKQN